MNPEVAAGEEAPAPEVTDAARKRAAVETYVRHEMTLRRTAQRYSLCADDADEALQRSLEILLRKAPSEDPRELIRWTQTVVKHEALAVRRERERILSGPAANADPEREDWVAQLPAVGAGPAEHVERREATARSREALRALKPQELRALSLLAQGYSYVEIGEITGFSQTKINRCLAEGRERYRRFLASSEDGGRCAEVGPLLSAFCDGEAGEDAAAVREHLRACAACRAALRSYRAAPHAALSLAPGLALARSFPERVLDAVAGLAARFGGGGAAEPGLSQAGAGGAGGAGLVGIAKTVALCAATAGGSAACVATGVVPAPLGIGGDQATAPRLERRVDSAWSAGGPLYEPVLPTAAAPAAERSRRSKPAAPAAGDDTQPETPAPEPAPAVAAAPIEEAAAPPEPVPVPEAAGEGAASGPTGGDPAGEFGP